mgnify:CR=1 FL=1
MFREIIDTLSLWLLPSIILLILTTALLKKVPIYETFIDGAKDGVKVSLNIVPYLVAIIVAISMLRASGAIESFAALCSPLLAKLNMPADVLPLAFVRSLSGSAAIGVFSDIIANNDVNSYTSKLAAIMMGSSETTFYVLTVYFGAVGIKKYRYALICGLIADLAGIIMSLIIASYFFS